MTDSELLYVPFRQARNEIRDSDLLLFRRRGLISIAGRGDHSHAAKAAWWDDDIAFVEGFNRAMLAEPRQIWAVAVPVTVRFDGDAQPGLPIHGHAFAAEDGAALLTLVSEPAPEDHVQGLGQSPQRSR